MEGDSGGRVGSRDESDWKGAMKGGHLGGGQVTKDEGFSVFGFNARPW